MGAGSSASLALRPIDILGIHVRASAGALSGEVDMEETKMEKIARLSGRATSQGLNALARHGFDLRVKLTTPISRVPHLSPPPEKPKSED